MKGKILTLLAGAAMLGSVGLASAAEPTTLSDEQLDAVAAGGTFLAGGVQANLGLAAAVAAIAPINAPVGSGLVAAAGQNFSVF